VRVFGQTSGGQPVRATTLSWDDGIEVEVLEFGAIVHALRYPVAGEGRRDAILSLDTLADYEADDRYIGQCVGRVANRIAGGRFALDGQTVRLSVNEPPNTLHGGWVGFGKRLWRFDEDACDARQAALIYVSPDGEEGFPATLIVRCVFAVTGLDTLEIAYAATAEAPTAVNLSHHLYFNLLGERTADILDHTVQIAADSVTPVGAGLIPTGEIASVANGALDLRAGARVRDVLARGGPQMALAGGLDFNWALTRGAAPAVRLTCPDGARLEIETDQPGLQVYSGQKLTPPFVPHGAVVFEPQGFPDAVNHGDFPSQILHPGETYRRTSRYRLTAG
jgi:aldose 1-epimerase